MPEIKIPKGWKKEGKHLTRTFKFKTSMEAVGFLNIVATISEELVHHPEITLHDYNKLTIKTTTHDKGKVTEKDIELARRVNLVPV